MLRFLSTLFTALALLASPLAMVGGGVAMAHVRPMETMVSSGHCSESKLPSSDHKSDIQINCLTACAGIPAVEPVVMEAVPPVRAAAVAAGHRTLTGVRPEGETPPPRSASEI